MCNLFDNYTLDGSSAPKPEGEVSALVRTINAMRADIIGAQEVESIVALGEVSLTHHVHILEMNGESYRLKQSEKRHRNRQNEAQKTAEME